MKPAECATVVAINDEDSFHWAVKWIKHSSDGKPTILPPEVVIRTCLRRLKHENTCCTLFHIHAVRFKSRQIENNDTKEYNLFIAFSVT